MTFEYFRYGNKHLGWCPLARALTRQPTVPVDNFSEDVPSQRTGLPARTGKVQRYRNQVLILAIVFTLAATPFIAFFQPDDLTRLIMYSGIIAGLVIFVFFGRWLWNSFEMLEKGKTLETGPGEYVISFFIAGAIPTGVVLFIAATVAIIQFAGVLAIPAFVTGFAFVPWYVFALIVLWEQRSGCILMFDKRARSFIGRRCSGNSDR